MVGAGLGAALAFLLEQIDEAITDPTEVRRKLGLPLLGTIPTVAEGRPDEALLDRKLKGLSGGIKKEFIPEDQRVEKS